VVKRHRDKRPQNELIDAFATAAEQVPQAAGDGGQQDVVHRRVAGVGDALHQIQAAADHGQAAAHADRMVQAGLGSTPLPESLACRRPCPPDPARSAGGVGQPRKQALTPVNAPAQVVIEQLALGGERGWCPWQRGRSGRGGADIEEHAEGGHPGHAVGDGMVHLHEQGDPRLCQAQQEPHLPQRAGPVQPPPPQLLAGHQQLRLAGGDSEREHCDMIGDVEGRGIYPQRPAQPPPRGVRELAEARRR
jgi:hypothetical protein